MLEKTHQFALMDTENTLVMTLYIETTAELLNGILIRQSL